MNITPFQAIYPKVDLITSPESFFDSMKYQFNEFYKSGFFDKSPQEALYVYRIENKTTGLISLGVVCCTGVEDLINNKILKHEKTLAAKEQQMMRLILQRQAYIKPVLLTYPDVPQLNNFLQKLTIDTAPFIQLPFSDENELHELWKITDGTQIEKVRKIFETKIKSAYVADGHHRCSTTQILYSSKELENAKHKFSSIFTIYIPESQLIIWDFNRVVEILDQIPTVSLITKLSQICKLKELKRARKPKRKFEMTMCVKNNWYSLKWKKKILEQFKDESVLLDVKLFNQFILNDICNVANVRTDSRISYYSGKEGVTELEEQVKKSSKRIAFAFYPVKASELMKIADKLETLPPKSTFFEPRMKNGIVSMEF